MDKAIDFRYNGRCEKISKLCEDKRRVPMTVQPFGITQKGEKASLYTLKNDLITATITDYGANLVSLIVKDKNGNDVDVVLGYDDAAGYEAGNVFFGAPVGRNGNRIGGATFTLGGVTYDLAKNDNGNNLHSGPDFFGKRMWEVVKVDDEKISFKLHSPEGDQGFPGAVDIYMSYGLVGEEIIISYEGVPNKDTILNMTNHSYFNLNGHADGDITGHTVTIASDFFTYTDEVAIPTGELRDVTDTPLDFRHDHVVSDGIDSDYEQIQWAGGFDHNWVLKNDGSFDKVATALGDKTGIMMEVFTDLPGMQFYTGNFIVREEGKKGAVYGKRSGFCMETQFFPDAIHHDHFDGPVTKRGHEYKTATAYRFSVSS